MKTKLGNETSAKEQNVTNKLINMYPALKRYCQFLTRNGWDAEDLAHEAIEKMYHAYINENTSHQHITHSLLYRIAHNHWVDQVRKRSKENGFVKAEPSTDPMKILPETYSISELLIKHLTPQQAVIFILKDVFQYGIGDVAKQLELSEGAIKASLFRARQHLRKHVSEDEANDQVDGRILTKEQIRLRETIIQSLQYEQPYILIKQYKRLYSTQIPMCKGQLNLQIRAAA